MTNMPKRHYTKSRTRYRRSIRILPIRARADPRLANALASIGAPEQVPFQPDPFQLEALAAIEHADCLVTAPTGSGKTWIAERAIASVLSNVVTCYKAQEQLG